MRPNKLLRFSLILLMLLAALFVHAQYQENEDEDDDEDGGGINIESDWSRAANLYNGGDQLFCINLGLVLPLFYADQSQGYFKSQMKLGGFGALAYYYFLDPHWFLGGELGGMFASTVGQNMYYIVPFGIRGGYQFIWNRFEFPLSMMLGCAPQAHADLSYFGLFSKLGAGAFFRFNSDWSFGLNTGFWWVPQWTSKSRPDAANPNARRNIHGFFWEISLGVRYHF